MARPGVTRGLPSPVRAILCLDTWPLRIPGPDAGPGLAASPCLALLLPEEGGGPSREVGAVPGRVSPLGGQGLVCGGLQGQALEAAGVTALLVGRGQYRAREGPNGLRRRVWGSRGHGRVGNFRLTPTSNAFL
ncbi:hypothetical protein chiPu_0029973, partial [Chiloscyllium punctatum]|nr:hypothetical protein [Chiloscyllium punctatum]